MTLIMITCTICTKYRSIYPCMYTFKNKTFLLDYCVLGEFVKSGTKIKYTK